MYNLPTLCFSVISPKIATRAGSVKDASDETAFTWAFLPLLLTIQVNPQVPGRAIIYLPGEASRQLEIVKEWEWWCTQPGYQRWTEKASGWVREGKRKSNHMVQGPEWLGRCFGKLWQSVGLAPDHLLPTRKVHLHIPCLAQEV